MPGALQRWAELVALVNGRTIVGMAGVRDPDARCEDFEPGEPTVNGDCITDGHYMCDECTRRATCPECGLRPWHCVYWGCGAKNDTEKIEVQP